MTTVLVVDDVPAMADQYTYDLRRLGGYDTLVAPGGTEALDLLTRERIDCVILDLEMPGTDGFDVLAALGKRGDATPVIVYTGTGDFDRCARAVRMGAFGFIDKAEPMARVIQEVENALEHRRLQQEVETLRSRIGADTPLLGDSPPMQELHAAIGRLAPIPSPVLIVGESGVGKELVARELHRRARDGTPRRPFVALNCAALPEHLVESELFGHERGAFTGAHRLRKGAFETASGGTLLLDEVGELTAGAQAKLLRVLEEGEVVRVGGTRPLHVEVRVVAATHRDLDASVDEGRFRNDLLYRLNAHVIRVPPLRERLADLPRLVDHFLSLTCARFGISPRSIDPAALDLLGRYDWRRNNVRELRNVVERLVIAAPGDRIGVEAVPHEIREASGDQTVETSTLTFRERKARAERSIVLAALERHDWQITETARDLGLADHASLLKIMRRHGIHRP